MFCLLWLAHVSSNEMPDESCAGGEELTALLQRSHVEVLARSSGTSLESLYWTTGSIASFIGLVADGDVVVSDDIRDVPVGENHSANDTTKSTNSTTVTNNSVTSEKETEQNSGPVVSSKSKVTVGSKTEQGKDKNSSNPFLKVNKTTKKYNVSIHAGTQEKKEVTIETTEVTIATPRDIVRVHFVVFLPLIILWLLYFCTGRQEGMYKVILPMTLCAMIVTQDLVNQSLAVVTKAPLGITACQASFAVLVTGIWSASVDLKVIRASDRWVYYRWCIVAILFTIYQLVNHLVSLYCSLSERTVFNNLCPVATILLETLVMPVALQPLFNCNIALALASLVTGALLFSFSSPDFTETGVLIAALMVVATVPYRLFQRAFLSDNKRSSIVFLAFIDSLFVFTVSFMLSLVRNQRFLSDLLFWFKHPSIFVMLVLSACTFAGTHLCSLALLRVSSATAYLVFQSLASFIEVALGILFFADTFIGTPMACIGLGLSLASGLWYSAEVSVNGKGFLLPPSGESDEACSALEDSPAKGTA